MLIIEEDPKSVAAFLIATHTVIAPRRKEELEGLITWPERSGMDLIAYHQEVLKTFMEWSGLTTDKTRVIIWLTPGVDTYLGFQLPDPELQASLLLALNSL